MSSCNSISCQWVHRRGEIGFKWMETLISLTVRPVVYTLNNIGYLKRTFSTINMQPQENPPTLGQWWASVNNTGPALIRSLGDQSSKDFFRGADHIMREKWDERMLLIIALLKCTGIFFDSRCTTLVLYNILCQWTSFMWINFLIRLDIMCPYLLI